MRIFSPAGHERIVIVQDRASGLRAVIALHSTVLGPGLGGTRFHPYASEDALFADALRLSRAMTYKNAAAGLAAGGGKAVILGDPSRNKTPALLRAYGRAVAALSGSYITACDVGTYVADMDVIAETCRWTTGRSRALGGAGDSGELTALGVFQGMRAAAAARWGEPSLAGRRVAITGLGKVGRRLAAHLLDDGAHVVGGDTSAEAVSRVRSELPAVTLMEPSQLSGLAVDVWSPNALGGALTDEVVAGLRAEIVCGGANNQLAGTHTTALLAAKGITWCPDYVVNAGGVIAVADEGLAGPYDHQRATARVMGIFDTTAAVLADALAHGITTSAAADLLAERALAAGRHGPGEARADDAVSEHAKLGPTT